MEEVSSPVVELSMVRLVESRLRQPLHYRKVSLAVCKEHEEPFASDSAGYIAESATARSEGRRVVVVALASDWEMMHNARGRPAYGPRS